MLSVVIVYFITGISYVSATKQVLVSKTHSTLCDGLSPSYSQGWRQHGLYSGLCCTLFKRYALNKQQLQHQERCTVLYQILCGRWLG
jgi:hypothetical protein